MKVVFLDVDGVLNSIESMVAYHHLLGPSSTIYSEASRLNPIAIGLLKCLCTTTEAKIVVSSTWRINYSLEELEQIFALYGWSGAPFIDKTGRGGINSVRGNEIQDWLDAHPDTTQYVIIDDDSDMLDDQMPHFVNTSGNSGFALHNLCHALHLLGCPNADLEAHAFFKRKKYY